MWLFRVSLLLLVLLLASAGWAQDWFSNDGPVRAAPIPGPMTPGSLWRVVGGSLNGRVTPGGRVVRVFPRGTVLQADVGRGGSDEVLVNALDAAGKPWMRVRTKQGVDLNCYVRANGKYLQPVK